MSDQPAASIQGVADAGVAGKHPPAEDPVFLVGAATASEFNTARLRLVPVACWRVDDIRFHFASSFVTPEIKSELQILAGLIKDHPGSPLSIFGHADPVGDDDFNKILSGRRATAIYALLTRNTSQWEELFHAPEKNDDWDKAGAIEVMLAEVSPDSAKDPNAAAKFKRDAGARKGLYAQYMDKLCGPGLQLAKTDFLGRGANPGGKADFQGCGEFNPALIFSAEKEKEFAADKDKSARNDANAPNRRVLVLLFRKGSRVDPARWPCPTVKEGVAGCHKRFWADGEKRRSTHLAGKDRKFEISHDTFACRFFHRLTSNSPCQKTLQFFRVRLYDPTGKHLPLAPFRLTVGGTTFPEEKADAQGFITGREVEVPNTCTVEWALPPADNPPVEGPQEFPFRLSVFLQPQKPDRQTRARELLNNLGYVFQDPFEENVAAFQTDYGEERGLKSTGKLDDPTMNLIEEVHNANRKDLRETTRKKASS